MTKFNGNEYLHNYYDINTKYLTKNCEVTILRRFWKKKQDWWSMNATFSSSIIGSAQQKIYKVTKAKSTVKMYVTNKEVGPDAV